ncbi:MAG: hypothetical protein ACD_76C00125G0006 [uncultured bacterium]|nr:MAG: hypothetical protein ACD_76C00125G0006 [uncultured bacterium]HBD05495.1 hypothetical protein [Candidatus Uhrbacteria bacterium]
MRKPDTDSDGFLDGNEVFHRYNPAGTAPLTLLESGFVKVYSNSLFSIQYPSQWTAVGQDFAVEFTALSGEKISISVQPRSLEGYLGAVLPAVYNAFTTKNGYSAALSEDQLTAVIDLSVPAKEAVLVSLIYKPDGNGEIDYLQTFKMMINSLQFVQPAE